MAALIRHGLQKAGQEINTCQHIFMVWRHFVFCCSTSPNLNFFPKLMTAASPRHKGSFCDAFPFAGNVKKLYPL